MAGQRKTFSTVAFTKPTAEESLPPAAPVAPTPPPVHTPVTPPTPHTSHTPTPSAITQTAATGRRTEPARMVRKTYYLSETAADALADAVDRIHYDSRGRVSKHQALAEIIAAGVAQVDAIAARLLSDS